MYKAWGRGGGRDNGDEARPPPRSSEGSELVLEQKEVVGCGDGNDVLVWVPGRVQDFLVEVQAVHVDLVLLALPAGAHLKKKK